MTRVNLEAGMFEFAVLAALTKDEYLSAQLILKTLQNNTSRRIMIGSLHVTLDRLFEKGFVLSSTLPPRSIPGGKARRTYRLTRAGEELIERTSAALVRIGFAVRVPTSLDECVWFCEHRKKKT